MSDFVLTCPCCGQPVPPGRLQALRSLDLTPRQRALVDTLAARMGEWVATDRLADAVYADDPDGGPQNPNQIVADQIYHMGDVLSAAGYAIEAYRGGSSGGSYRRLVVSRVYKHRGLS